MVSGDVSRWPSGGAGGNPGGGAHCHCHQDASSHQTPLRRQILRPEKRTKVNRMSHLTNLYLVWSDIEVR